MTLPIVILAYGTREYLDESLESIRWHRRHGMTNPIQLWLDPSFGKVDADAEIKWLEPVTSSSPSYVIGWYHKTHVLRMLCEGRVPPFCLLDSYARVLKPDLFNETYYLLQKFPVCLALDPRRTLAAELQFGRGISPEVTDDVKDIPRTFPLWNTGVIFTKPSEESQKLFTELEMICRGYLDRGLAFREQIGLVKAVLATGISPFTLPDNYNVRRPFIDPAIVLHTRRYGHFYGVPEVDTPVVSFEKFRHRAKAALMKLLRLQTLLSS